MSDLKDALEVFAEKDEAVETFLQKYSVMQDYLEKEYYPWIQSKNSYFTDHGKGHIKAVKNKADGLLSQHLEEPNEGDLNPLDIYIILSAIIWHDVGMVKDRKDHEDKSADILERFEELFPNIGVRTTIQRVAKAHTGQEGLSIPKAENHLEVDGKDYKVKPRSLAAIVRFADEISETQSRVSGSDDVLEEVPNEQKIYWKYANSIHSCKPQPNNERVRINIEMDIEDAITEFICKDYPSRCNKDNKMTLIEYVICRLEKLNEERSYCDREFREYTTIRQSIADITLRGKGGEVKKSTSLTLENGMDGSYPKINIFEDFFGDNLEWKPDSLKKEVKDNG